MDQCLLMEVIRENDYFKINNLLLNGASLSKQIFFEIGLANQHEMYLYLKGKCRLSFEFQQSATSYFINGACLGGHLYLLKRVYVPGLIKTTESSFGPKYPIEYATKGGHLELVKWLWEKDKFWGDSGNFAAMEGHLEILKWMVGRGCNLKDSWFEEAAMNNHSDITNWILDKKQSTLIQLKMMEFPIPNQKMEILI